MPAVSGPDNPLDSASHRTPVLIIQAAVTRERRIHSIARRRKLHQTYQRHTSRSIQCASCRIFTPMSVTDARQNQHAAPRQARHTTAAISSFSVMPVLRMTLAIVIQSLW